MSTAAAFLTPDDFSVKLEFFSGPMDLLLHLVEQQEVEIEKVDLRTVCEQYLAIVSHSAELDLDKASEYLVVAATLAAKKSEALLPDSNRNADGAGLVEEFDPRFFSELRERLKAYRDTKHRAEKLLGTPQLGVDVFAPRRMVIESENAELHEEVRGEGRHLGSLFFTLLKRIGVATTGFRVTLEPITVVKYMVSVLDILNIKKAGKFLDVVRGIRDKGSLKARVTGAFIASLELAKRGIISVNQLEDGISLDFKGGDSSQLASEFDKASNVIELARRIPAEQEATFENESFQYMEANSGRSS